MSPELSELATIVAVVVGGKEEGGRDDMADSQKKRPTVSRCEHLPRPTPPPLTMPRCPSCSKILPSDEAVQRHMNQPASHCHRWVDDLVRLSEVNEIEAVHNPQQDWNSLDPPDPDRFDEAEAEMDVIVDEGPGDGLVEEFPGAAKIFQVGEQNTFLHKFDQDPFSNERRENLYYPFASRMDWEFGLWLTRSGLSLAAVDSLLSLDLVSPFNVHPTYPHSM